MKWGRSGGEGRRVDRFTFGLEIPEDIHERPYRMSIALCFLHRMFSAQLTVKARIVMIPVLQVRIEIHKG